MHRSNWCGSKKPHNEDSFGEWILNIISRISKIWILRIILPLFAIFSATLVFSWLQLPLDIYIILIISAVFSLTFALLSAFSTQVWCVFWLCIPSLGGKLGQKLIFYFISWTLFNVPMQNILHNLNSTATAFGCIVREIENDTSAVRDVLTKTQERLQMNIQSEIEKLAKANKDISQVIDNATIVARGLDTAMQRTWDVIKDSDRHCNTVLSGLGEGCGKVTGFATDACNGIDKAIGIFGGKIPGCEKPRESSGCSNWKNICNPLRTLRDLQAPSITQYFEYFRNMVKLDVTSEKKINSNSNVEEGVEQMKETVSIQFKMLFEILEWILYVIQWFLSSLILLIPLESWSYLRQTRNVNSFNFWGTFKTKSKAKPKKKSNLYISLIVTLGFSIFSMMFLVLLERIVYHSQLVAKVASNQSLDYSSEVSLKFNVGGGLLLTEFIRGIVDSIKLDSSISFDVNIADCLPDPVEPTSVLIFLYLLVMYSIIVILVCFEDRVVKIRINLIQVFYPEVVHLNSTASYSNGKESEGNNKNGSKAALLDCPPITDRKDKVHVVHEASVFKAVNLKEMSRKEAEPYLTNKNDGNRTLSDPKSKSMNPVEKTNNVSSDSKQNVSNIVGELKTKIMKGKHNDGRNEF